MAQIEKANFAEKEYEFAFNHEFVNEHKHFRDFSFRMPNLRQEAKVTYDTRFDWDREGLQFSKFFQYKIPEYVIHPKKSDVDILNFFKGPYFTYGIRKTTKSQQHVLLYLLSRGGEDVSYASPLFHHRKNFLENCKNNSIKQNSIFFDPKDIPLLVDDKQHYLSYDVAGTIGIFKSNPTKIPLKNFHDEEKKLKDTKLIDEDYIENLFEKLIKCIKETYQIDPTVEFLKN